MREMKIWNCSCWCRGNAATLFIWKVLQLIKNFEFHVHLTTWLFLPVFFQTWLGFFSQEMSGNPVHDFSHSVFETVEAASLLIASRGGASPQKFEKRALTIFFLEPDPYNSAHQLNCSLLFPTAMLNGIESTRPILVIKPNKQQTSATIDRQHDFWNTTETN